MATRSCPHCGHTILMVARFCGRCGQSSVPTAGELGTAEVEGAPSTIEPLEAPRLAEGVIHEEATRANWRPDPEILAAAAGPKPSHVPLQGSAPVHAAPLPAAGEPPRVLLKTALGMPAPTLDAPPNAPAYDPLAEDTATDGGAEHRAAAMMKAQNQAAFAQVSSNATLPLNPPPALTPPPPALAPVAPAAAAPAQPPPAAQPEGGRSLMKTALMPMHAPPPQEAPAMHAQVAAAPGFPAPQAAQAPQAPVGAQQPEVLAPTAAPPLRTMLGVAMPGIAPVHATPEEPPKRVAALGTLLGVAAPGIAPSSPPPAGSSAPPGGPGAPGSEPVLGARSNRTLLGVSGPPKGNRAPAIDPHAPGVLTAAFKIPTVLPAPAPPPSIELPEAPELGQKKGFPVAPVVGGAALLLAVGGAALFFTLKSGPPLTAQGRVDETGKEALAIHCPSCPDGTKLSLGQASVDVKAGEALLPLAEPLALGANEFQVTVKKPSGRDDTVKLSVPVSYRVRADLASLGADPPAIVVHAEAIAGAKVEVGGQPVPIPPAGGKGDLTFPLGDETVGPSDDSKLVERSLPFKVTLPDRAETGALPVRARVVPLHLDAPGTRAVVAQGPCKITGQTVVGGKLFVNGKEVTLGSRGEFQAEEPCAAPGAYKVEVIAKMQGLASRKASFTITRVPSLEAEAKAWDTRGLVAFADIPKPESVGKPTEVEGEVVEARSVNGLTVGIVDNRRGCKSACLVRVLYGGPEGLQKGQTVKVYGYPTRVVTADGRTVPEIDSAFVLGERKPR